LRIFTVVSRRLLAIGIAAFLVLCISAGAADASGPTATVTPSSGLSNLQVVTVKGSGFPPYTRMEIMECSGTLANPPKDNTPCQGLTLNTESVTNLKGAFVNEPKDPSGLTGGYRILTLPQKKFSPYPPDCDKTHPCGLFIGVDETDFTQPHLFVPFSFAGAPGQKSAGSSSAPIAIAVVVVLVLAGVAFVVLRRRRSHRAISTWT